MVPSLTAISKRETFKSSHLENSERRKSSVVSNDNDKRNKIFQTEIDVEDNP